MSSNRKLMVMPGDGIGPEVMNETLRLLDWLAKYKNINFDTIERDVGGKSYDLHGTPLTDEALSDALECDAVLFGAVGGPKYDDLDFELKPERGLLTLRKELDLFANLRPAIVFPPLVEASTLKPEVVEGLDIMILRELTGGVYFAEPRGIDIMPDGSKKGYDTNLYTTPEIERIGRVAFDLAKKRNNKVTSVEKANVMLSGVLWREVITELHKKEVNNIKFCVSEALILWNLPGVAVIENVPIFPGCDKGNNAAKRKCMSDKIAKFVQRKFNTELAGDLGLGSHKRL